MHNCLHRWLHTLSILNTCSKFLKTLHHLCVGCEGRAPLVDLRVGTAPPILSFVSVCSAEQWEEKLTQVVQTLAGPDSGYRVDSSILEV